MSNDTPTPFEIQAELQRVTDWAMKCAAEHVDGAHFDGDVPDPDWGMGLWQSFNADFDIDEHHRLGVRELAINTASHAFRRTVELLDAKARQVCELGAALDHQKTVKLNPAP